MRKRVRGECILITMAGLGCLAVMVALMLAGGYFYRQRGALAPTSTPMATSTPEASRRAPEMRLEGTALGEADSVVKGRFPQMVLKEEQTVPLIMKGYAHGRGSKQEPTEILFRDGKVTEIRFAKSLEVNGRTFLAVDKPSLESLNQTLGISGVESRLTQLPPTFWIFDWDDRQLSVVVLETGHFFSLDSQP